MQWQSDPFIWLLLATAVVAILAAIFAWQRRAAAAGALPMAVLLVLGAWWCFGYAAELTSPELPQKLFWVRAQWLSISVTPLAWLTFVIQFTGLPHPPARLRLLLAGEAALTMILVLTNSAHELVFGPPALAQVNSYILLQQASGPWFWVHIVCAYCTLSAGGYLLLRTSRHSRRIYRLQSMAALAGVTAPFLASLLNITRLSPLPGLDLTPVAFSFTAAASAWAMFRLYLWDVLNAALAEQASSLRSALASLQSEVDERRKAEAALAERAEHLALLNEITRIAISTQDFSAMLQALADRLGDLIGADGCFITEWDEERQAAEPLAASSPMRALYLQLRARPGEKTLTQAVLAARRPLIAEDTHNSPFLSAHVSQPFPTQSLLGLPLIAGEQKLGALLMGFDGAHDFTPDEIARCEQAAGHLALALARARLFAATQRDAEELRIAGEILHALNATPGVHSAFAEIFSHLAALSGCSCASVALIDPLRREFVLAMLDRPRPEAPAGVAFPLSMTAATADVLAGRIHMTPDLAAELAYPLDRTLYEAGHRSRINLPLRTPERVIGSLNLNWPEVAGYRHANLDRLGQIADALAIAVERNRLFEETHRRNQELALLNAVAGVTSHPSQPAGLLEEVLAAVLPALNLDAGWVILPGPTLDDPPTVPASRGVSEAFLAAETSLPLIDCPLCPETLRTGRIQGAAVLASCPRLGPGLAAFETLHNHVAIPIVAHESVLGIVNVGRRLPAPWDDRLLALLTTIGQQVGLALENARLYQAQQEHASALEATVARRTAELQAANWSLMEAADRLRELDRLKSQFVSNVSHELRTPLANIKLYLSLVQRGKPEKQELYLETLNREADLLHRLIEDLLDLSRLDLGKMQPALAPVDAGRLATQLAHDRTALLAERGLELRLEVTPDLPHVAADAGMLTQVLTNLTTNAMNYTPAGGAITISARLERPVPVGEPSWVVVSVSDTGSGIAPEDQPHIFERFYRGQAAHTSGAPGTGLGLAICQEIISRHNGYISLQSLPGHGSCFQVWLPLAAAAPDQDARNLGAPGTSW